MTDFLKQKKILMTKATVPENIFSRDKNEYDFVWIHDVPIQNVLNLRNAKHVLENTYDSTPISIDQHAMFIKNYDELERADFVCRDKQALEYIGAFSIVKTFRGLEVGNYIGNTNYLGKGLAFPIMNSFIRYIDAHFEKTTPLISITKITNLKNINLNFKLGFKISHQLGDEFWLMTRTRVDQIAPYK